MVEIDRFNKVQTLMYTQCPDCSTAFRVTAEVLKQAAGKVRCGGCGNAFNALAYLSESMPEQAAPKDAEEALPELKPEPLKSDDGLPKSISAEQSAALLKTLDELAGSDIRIEDTGVEWRVLDDDELGEAADDESAEIDEVSEVDEIDEYLDDSPTPVDQFLTETPAQVESPEIFAAEANEPAQTPVDELRFDDNTPLPDDFDLDNESSYAPLPFAEPEEPEAIAAAPADSPQADFDLSEPDEWTDILDEFEDLAEVVAAPLDAEIDALEDLEDELAEDDEIVATLEADIDDSVDEPLDMDSQFAIQAEAMGIDLSGIYESPQGEELPGTDDEVDLEQFLDESDEEQRDIDDLLEEELVDEVAEDDEFELAAGETGQLELIDEEPDEDLEEELDDLETEYDEFDEEVDEDLDELDREFDELQDELDEAAVEDKHYIPPLTEEEQTINMQIDQDLMALAIEDDDGFTSTMILPEDAVEKKGQGKSDDDGHDDKPDEEKSGWQDPLKDTSAGFETIIMEGESIRSGRESESLAADSAAAAAASLASAAAAQRDAEKTARSGNRRYGIIGGIVLLALLLAGQYLHQSRESLATIPAFNRIVGPVYRAIGQPLSPEWDITGWRFEATKGSTDESDENLTIYSRIGNKSDQPLPYPIVAISLTDRFEETVGSRILDPADYLSKDLDPRKLVQPGNTFNAVITIQSPSEDATGFKLNVCYRESGGDLRCAIDDFK